MPSEMLRQKCLKWFSLYVPLEACLVNLLELPLKLFICLDVLGHSYSRRLVIKGGNGGKPANLKTTVLLFMLEAS